MPPESTEGTGRRRALLLASAFTVAASGLAYELIGAAVSSYFLGDAFTQYSLAIGVFLCAMGLGAHLARYVEGDLTLAFVRIEIAVGLVGGTASLAMFALNAFVPSLFEVGFYTLAVAIGVMVGIEIPLLVRIGREGSNWSDSLSSTLALDYAGALVGSVALPLIVLPQLGLARASVVFGLANLAVAWAGTTLLSQRMGQTRGNVFVAALVLVGAFAGSGRLVGFLEDQLYEDEIVYAASTPYQRIVLTRWRGDVRLFLDGHLQFSSVDEARYHEALVLPAMEAAGRPAAVLVLGGGDGMAAREALKYGSVRTVDVVDLDPEITRLFATREELLRINGGALLDPRVTVHNTDAMAFLERAERRWDVIVGDLVDPHAEALARLYSAGFYSLVARRLTDRGVFVTQATSPFYAPEAFWCIVRTLETAGEGPVQRKVTPWRMNVPSFGEWGFVALAGEVVTPRAPSVATRHLDADSAAAMSSFGAEVAPEVEVNTLDHPVLAAYYRRGWRQFRD